MHPKRNGPSETKEEYLDWLKANAEHTLGCPAYYLRTEIVREAIEGHTVWLGEVGVFGLIGHLEAKRCFAWGHAYDRSETNGDIVVVLEQLPTPSAQHAVRAQLRKDLEQVPLHLIQARGGECFRTRVESDT